MFNTVGSRAGRKAGVPFTPVGPAIYVGNSSVNVFANSTMLRVINSTASINIAPNSLLTGITTVNATHVAVGANVILDSGVVFVGNSTVNNWSNSTILRIVNSTSSMNILSNALLTGISVVNATHMAIGANVIIDSVRAFIGNSTVNTAANSLQLAIANSTTVSVLTSSALTVGSNVIVNTDVVFIGNSTVNAWSNSTFTRIVNSTASMNLSSIALVTGITTVNATHVAVGANVLLDSGVVFVGNSTVNNWSNSTIIRIVNSTASMNLTSSALATGITTVNATHVAVGANLLLDAATAFIGNSTVNAAANSLQIAFSNSTTVTTLTSSALTVGANASINTTVIFIGNSTVNNWTNSTFIQIVNSTASMNLTSSALVTGITTVNATQVTVGANVIVNATHWAIGNSTVNVVSNSSQISWNDPVGSAAANPFGFYVGTTVVNSSVVFVGNSTVNAFVNSTMVWLGNSTVNTHLAVPTSVQYSATNYFLHANGDWVQVTTGGGNPGGANQEIQFNDSGVFGGNVNFTFDKATLRFTVGNSTVNVFSNSIQFAVTNSTSNINITSSDVTKSGVSIVPFGTQTIWVPAGAMISRTTNGPASGNVELATNRIQWNTLDFDATVNEHAQFWISFPKSWDEGTVTAQFYWSQSNTTTNFGVVWALSAVAFSNDDAGDAAFGTEVTVADTGGTNNDIYISDVTSAMTIAGTPTANDMICFQVKRLPANASDTMTVDARLHGLRLFYTVDAAKDD